MTPDDPQAKFFYSHMVHWSIATITQNVNSVAQLILDIEIQVPNDQPTNKIKISLPLVVSH